MKKKLLATALTLLSCTALVAMEDKKEKGTKPGFFAALRQASKRSADITIQNLHKDLTTFAENFADPDIVLVKQIKNSSKGNQQSVPAAFLCAVENKRIENVSLIQKKYSIDTKTMSMAQATAKKQRMYDAQELRKTYEQLQQLLFKHNQNTALLASLGIAAKADDFNSEQVFGEELNAALDGLMNAGENNSRTKIKDGKKN